MRRIIFRAKLRENVPAKDIAGKWVYWNVFGEFTTENGKRHTLSGKTSEHSTHFYYNIEYLSGWIDRDTICMSTGLSDIHRKKIFEGDIVRHYCGAPDDPEHYVTDTIVWNDKYCGFERTDYRIHADCKYEVIGNIFDNPEETK